MDSAPELTDPERAHLITPIINSIGRTGLVNARGWAALWFADIEVLRSYAQGDTMQNWIILELLGPENNTFPRLLLDCMLVLIERDMKRICCMSLLTISTGRGVPIDNELNARHEESTRKRRLSTMELARKSGMSFQARAEDDSLWPPTTSPDHCSEDAMQIVGQLRP